MRPVPSNSPQQSNRDQRRRSAWTESLELGVGPAARGPPGAARCPIDARRSARSGRLGIRKVVDDIKNVLVHIVLEGKTTDGFDDVSCPVSPDAIYPAVSRLELQRNCETLKGMRHAILCPTHRSCPFRKVGVRYVIGKPLECVKRCLPVSQHTCRQASTGPLP